MGITKAELLERDPVFDVDMPDWVRVIIRYDVNATNNANQ